MQTSAHFINFMSCQITKINLEVLSNDDNDIINWIQNNSAFFRKEWENSICKNCQKVKMCGYKAKKECLDFSEFEK